MDSSVLLLIIKLYLYRLLKVVLVSLFFTRKVTDSKQTDTGGGDYMTYIFNSFGKRVFDEECKLLAVVYT